MDDISERYKSYSIDILREVIRTTDKGKRPDLFEKAKIELENKIIERKYTGSFNYKDGTELFLDSYVDEKLTELSFNNDNIIIKNKTSNSYFYIMLIAFIFLLVIITTLKGNFNYYFLILFLVIGGGYFSWRILNEKYQYSRITKIDLTNKIISIKIKPVSLPIINKFFNLTEGNFKFEEIEGFYRKTTRNIFYSPTNWISVIKIKIKDRLSPVICFISNKKFAKDFSEYLNYILRN